MHIFCSQQDSSVMTFGISAHRSWWRDNGCPQPLPLPLLDLPAVTSLICSLPYHTVEVIHSSLQITIAVSQTGPEGLLNDYSRLPSPTPPHEQRKDLLLSFSQPPPPRSA
uniref:Sodium/potassium-transporting ATPase subunit beta-1-interacting protein n=1 Tax=Eptatretus burgeri TaxID=7764 RepID=A0A8C4WZL1_EPTBU